MPKTWTVSYTARRKRSIYERRTVTVQVTEEQYRQEFGDALKTEFIDPVEIEQLAIQREYDGLVPESDCGPWETYLKDAEDLNESDFEVEESGSV